MFERACQTEEQLQESPVSFILSLTFLSVKKFLLELLICNFLTFWLLFKSTSTIVHFAKNEKRHNCAVTVTVKPGYM